MLLAELCLALHELKAPYGATTKYLCYYGKSVAINVALVKTIDFSECHAGVETAASIFLSANNVRNVNIQTSVNFNKGQYFFGLLGQYS